MKEQTVRIGNAFFVLTGNNDLFNDGYTTGYLEFYDERHRPPFPLTSHVIRDHLLTIINESSCSEFWKAGRVTGWMEALMENCPQTFRSFIPEERMGVLPRRKRRDL
jgi:hypothetical protein